MGALDGRRIGFIGLGAMGRPMARNLHAAGARVTITSRSKGPVEGLAGDGLTPAATPRAVAEASEITVVIVTDTAALDAVLHGADGVIAGLAGGDLVIDMGTDGVAETRQFAREAQARGAEYVDAPVSGGVVGAANGTLSIMAGGSEAAFATAKPVLDVLGRNVTHVGPSGAGQVTKLANQMIVALTIGAVSEAFTLARHAGVEPAKVREALMGGFADSRILELHGQRMVDGAFAPGGRAVLQRKDVLLALDVAASAGVRLPGLETNRALWDRMIEKGWGDLDHSALIKAIEDLQE